MSTDDRALGQRAQPAPLPDAAVVVPAGGAGLRMGGPRKQFRLLGGEPVLVHALRACGADAAVGWRVVAVPEAEAEAAEAMLAAHGLPDVRVVPGGPTRQASVARALAAVDARAVVTLVHDAVRPFLPVAVLSAVLAAARARGAAAAAVPVADTLRRLREDGRLGAAENRDELLAMQTPQGARTAWLRDAYACAASEGFEGTDDVALLQAAGYPVVPVQGDARLFKLTRPSDFALAEALLPAWPQAAGDGGRSRTDAPASEA